MLDFFKKKMDLEEQSKLFDMLSIGDIFWARMSLDKTQEKRIEESHKKRPFLMIGKDDDIYALALTSKYYPNGYYPITKKKYHNLKKDSYIDLREINVITKENLESFSFKIFDDDLNKVIKLYNLLKDKGEHSLEVDYQTRFSLGDLVDCNGNKYLIYQIEDEKIYGIRLNYSINETDLKFGSVYFDTNFKVRIFRDEFLKLEGVCNNLVFEKIKRDIDKKIPVLDEYDLEEKEEDLNNCLKLIRFTYLDENNDKRHMYLNTLTFSATKAYGNNNLDMHSIISLPFIDYEVIRDLTNEEKKKLIINTREEMLKNENIKLKVPFKMYKNNVKNMDIYQVGDIFNYKGKMYILYKKDSENLFTIKLKNSNSSNFFIDGKRYKLSNIKRKFNLEESFEYIGFHSISKLKNKINEIDQKGTFIEFGSIINVNGEDIIVIYEQEKVIWGISNLNEPVLKKITTNDYSILGDVSIKNLKKLKQIVAKINNLLPIEIEEENKEVSFGDIISFKEDDKITNLIILKNIDNKFYGIKNFENPEIYRYKLYKNRYQLISHVSNEMLVSLKNIYDNNEKELNETTNFRKGR